MKRSYAGTLLFAVAMSSAALAAPKSDSETGYDSPGAYFNCLVPYPGPNGFRKGGCWLDGAVQG